jgi:hypothetical protein
MQQMTITTDNITTADRELILYLSAGRNHAQTLKSIRLEFTADRLYKAALHRHRRQSTPSPMATQRPGIGRGGAARRGQ